jgi:hypothetical protein
MKWSFTKGKETAPWWEISHLSMEIPDYSKRGLSSNWFWNGSQIVVCESFAPIYTPHEKNESGQHLEHSPFCERDFAKRIETHDEKKETYQN